MKREPTKTEQAYKKERTRIQHYIARKKKEGYLFPEDILPKKPKKITEASVKKLKKLSAKELIDKAEYLDKETGEVKSGRRAQWEKRQEGARKAALTRKRKQAEKSAPLPARDKFDELLEGIRAMVLETTEAVEAQYNAPTRNPNTIQAASAAMRSITQKLEEKARETGKKVMEEFPEDKKQIAGQLGFTPEDIGKAQMYEHLESKWNQYGGDFERLLQVIQYDSDQGNVSASGVTAVSILERVFQLDFTDEKVALEEYDDLYGWADEFDDNELPFD